MSGLVLHVLDASPMMKVISFLMTSDDLRWPRARCSRPPSLTSCQVWMEGL